MGATEMKKNLTLYEIIDQNKTKLLTEALKYRNGAYIDKYHLSYYGMPPVLHYAARYASVSIILSLLGIGPDLTVKDRDGLTALYAAVEKDKKESVCLLLEAMQNFERRNKQELKDMQAFDLARNNPSLKSVFLSYGYKDAGIEMTR